MNLRNKNFVSRFARNKNLAFGENLVSRFARNWKYQFQQYGAALVAAAVLFAILSVYLFFRRGYYDLYIANKVFAGVAAVLLGIVLLIGPLSRFFSFPDRYVQYRKELGIAAFFLALTHGIVSLFFLPSKFPLSGSLGTLNWPFVFGLAATIVLVVIFFISNDRAMAAIGRERWWQWQYWGVRLAFILILLHVFIMKWGGWVKWYKVGGGRELVHPEWPGAGLLVGWFLSFVLLVRLAEFGGPRFGRAVWYISVVALPAIYIVTFWWGRQFIK
ncbi:MAG: ferric reductase-like transmembrane domain-containing protein [bacterium]|nr:ferric reductase-like transmembrane domain-containing protein [bacterium]